MKATDGLFLKCTLEHASENIGSILFNKQRITTILFILIFNFYILGFILLIAVYASTLLQTHDFTTLHPTNQLISLTPTCLPNGASSEYETWLASPLHNHDPGLALIAHRPMTGEAARDRRIMGWFNALVCRTQRHLLTCSSLFSSVRKFFFAVRKLVGIASERCA
jgi:hypothetical protein